MVSTVGVPVSRCLASLLAFQRSAVPPLSSLVLHRRAREGGLICNYECVLLASAVASNSWEGSTGTRERLPPQIEYSYDMYRSCCSAPPHVLMHRSVLAPRASRTHAKIAEC